MLYRHLKVTLLLEFLQMTFLPPQPNDGPYMSLARRLTSGISFPGFPQPFLWIVMAVFSCLPTAAHLACLPLALKACVSCQKDDICAASV